MTVAHVWLPRPRQFPNKCFMTGVSDLEHGPYLEIDAQRPYIDPGTQRPGRQYWSFPAWRTTVVDPNSPYKTILDDEVERRTEQLSLRIRDLERELAQDPMRVAFKRIEDRLAADTPMVHPAADQETRKVGVPDVPEKTPEPQAQRPRRRNR